MGIIRSKPIMRLAEKQPTLMRFVTSLWFRTFSFFNRDANRDPHWVLLELSRRLRYRLPVKAKLGNGMQIWVPMSDFIGRSIYNKAITSRNWSK